MYKKLMFFLMMYMSLKLCIFAEVEYLEYGPFSEWQEKEVVGSELIDVEKEIRYKWYKEERADGDYSIEGYNNSLFPFIDKSDFIITDFTDYSIQKPIKLPNRTIEQEDKYYYRKMQPVRYIYIMDAYSPLGYFGISELNIFIDDKRIAYDYYCGHCSTDFAHYINDGNVYQDGVYIRNGTTFRIDLGGFYDATKIRIDLYLYDILLSYKTYNIILSPYYNETQPQYFYKEFQENFFCNNISEVKYYSYNLDNSWIKKPEWYEWEYSEDVVEPSLTTEVKKQSLYRYKDILYNYYQINKIYYDDNYYATCPNYNYRLDNNDYRYYYRYRTKITLEPIKEDDKTNIIDNIDSGSLISEFGKINKNVNLEKNMINLNKDRKLDIFTDVDNDSSNKVEVISKNQTNEKNISPRFNDTGVIEKEKSSNEKDYSSFLAFNMKNKSSVLVKKITSNQNLYIVSVFILVIIWFVMVIKYYRKQKM